MAGTYFFAFRLMFLPSAYLQTASLMVDNGYNRYTITSAYRHPMEKELQAGNNVIVRFNKNDQVFVKVHDGNLYGFAYELSTSFLGYLLY